MNCLTRWIPQNIPNLQFEQKSRIQLEIGYTYWCSTENKVYTIVRADLLKGSRSPNIMAVKSKLGSVNKSIYIFYNCSDDS